jgi:tetratricopeptide (TPR) repeat protein
MFKLLKKLFAADFEKKSTSTMTVSKSTSPTAWELQIVQAEELWGQGKLTESLATYSQAIKQNPELPEIHLRLAERLKQQGDLAAAYEKLAIDLKHHGNIEQAANYYRQAINIKALTRSTKQQLLKSGLVRSGNNSMPGVDLKNTAFSFQPLTNSNSALVKIASQNPSLDIQVENSTDYSPLFADHLKVINPKQAIDIDWETAQVYLQQALDHSEKQQWKETAIACKQATQILPDMAEAYKIWGNALQRMGQTADAMSCYTKAVEIKPNLAEVYAGIADIYTKQQRWQQAIQHYQKAIIIKPRAEEYRSLANAWQQIGESEKAQLNIYKAVELESEQILIQGSEIDSLAANSTEETNSSSNSSNHSVQAYSRIAKKLEQQNRWQEAAIYYRKALALSTSGPALLTQASNNQQSTQSNSSEQEQRLTDEANYSSETTEIQTQESQSQLNKAIKRYHKQSRLQPNSAKIHTDLGNLYERKRKWQYAISCYRKAIDLDSQYVQAHLKLARTLFRIGKQQEFIKEMQLALALQPDIGSAIDRFYLGNALTDQGQQEQAISFYYQAILLNPSFVQAYHRLGEVLSQQGKHLEAIDCCQRGIEHNPGDAESYYLLGQQLAVQKNWDQAVKAYTKVLQLEPQFPGASQKLNHTLAKKLKLSQKSKSQP